MATALLLGCAAEFGGWFEDVLHQGVATNCVRRVLRLLDVLADGAKAFAVGLTARIIAITEEGSAL